uniref:Uncharacterized protein n=1 Tax=Eutreptiella gymnastica TaxID=73025 RepID=A0A7S1N911_9EUGL|mmetsp:Transcript_136289/g.236444  ORF Transcript_136289/g.236444 Transcript_136289/m.236444 type:complete len:162 (+) Transcript_136289:134-619(+)
MADTDIDPIQAELIGLSGRMLKALQDKDLDEAYQISKKILELDPDSAVAKEYHALLKERFEVIQREKEEYGEENWIEEEPGLEDAQDVSQAEVAEVEEEEEAEVLDGTEQDPGWGQNSILARLERFDKEGPEAIDQIKEELVKMGVMVPAVDPGPGREWKP